MTHGGRRKGAGAPRGNLNGLKHGRYSKQFAEIGALFAMDPRIRASLLALAKRHDLKVSSANEVSARAARRRIRNTANRVRKISPKAAPNQDPHTNSET